MAPLLPLPRLQRLFLAYPRELASAALLGLAAAAAIAGIADARMSSANPSAALPAPAPERTVRQVPVAEPLVLRPVAAQTAVELNAAMPVSTVPNPAARPFHGGRSASASGERALECLTSAVYYEAAGESPDGQRGVAQVVLNRVRHPAYPATVCAVVYQGAERSTGCQFTFTCDGSLSRRPSPASWARARRIARSALDGRVYAPVGNSTHYHAEWVLPYWSASLAKSAVVGAHIFYRWDGHWGRPAAFSQAYARTEPDPQLLRRQALVAAGAGSLAEQAGVASPAADPLLRLIERQPVGGGERVVLRIARRGTRAVAIDARPAYVERMDASANLRWTLGQEDPAALGAALGRKPRGGLPGIVPPVPAEHAAAGPEAR